MIRRLRLVFIGTLVPLLLNAEEALWQHPLNPVQKKTLCEGEVLFLTPESRYLAAAAIQIEAPASLVWEVMLDNERLPDYVKDVRSSVIRESGDNWKILEHRLKVHPLLPHIYYVFKEEYEDDFLIEFRRLEGGIKELMGWWKILPGDKEGTVILMYSVFMDIGWYVPKSFIRSGVTKRIPELLKSFREEVLSELEKEKLAQSE